MLLVKNLVDTVLSADLKELVNDGNSGNFNRQTFKEFKF